LAADVASDEAADVASDEFAADGASNKLAADGTSSGSSGADPGGPPGTRGVHCLVTHSTINPRAAASSTSGAIATMLQ
jgi:hypothetical protein